MYGWSRSEIYGMNHELSRGEFFGSQLKCGPQGSTTHIVVASPLGESPKWSAGPGHWKLDPGLTRSSRWSRRSFKAVMKGDSPSRILRDISNFRSWQHRKRSNSARLPSKIESWMQSWRPHTNAFFYFATPCVSSTAPATKKWCQVIQSAAPVKQNHPSKPQDLIQQNATHLRKSAPGPPNMSDSCVSCIAPATRNASLQSLRKFPRLPTFLKLLQNPHVLLTFGKVQNPLRLP